MSSTHFAWRSAILLSLCTLSDAWVLHRKVDSKIEEVDEVAPVELRRHEAQDLGLEKRQTTSLYCPSDRYQLFLDSNPTGNIQTFCNEWLGLAPATTVVEYTPTITVTTSAESTTTAFSTTRILTTETVTATATTTVGQPLVGRAANIAAVAQDIINSVLISGVPANATADAAATQTKNEQRIQAESGLANACSCKLVDPTSTVTESYAVPPVYTTVGYRIVVLVQSTETRQFTSVTTVTESLAIASTPVAMSTVAGPSDTPTEPTMSVETSGLPERTTLPSGEVIPPSNTTNSSSPAPSSTVIALPFSCPDAGNQQVDQVVGNYKLDYLVYCNTEITSEDRVGPPISTDSETSCTAQCSVLNAQSGQGTCQAAAFIPYTDGRSGGNCILSGKNTEYASKPGSVVVVNTGIESNDNDCAAFDEGRAPTPIDTSAIVAAITGGVALATPGLITQTQDGGVFETYVSANSTDAGGTVHWSWYRVSASSSYWQAVYATSWSCTRTIVQTVVQQPATPLPASLVTELETTIINGATTTIIRGSSTQIIVGGGGVFGPSVVPASTTTGNGEITTFFSTATAISTGDSGIIPPSTGAVPTPSLPIPSGSLPAPSLNVTTIVGSTAIVISGSTSTYVSTGTGDVIPPEPSSPGPFVSTTTTTTTLGGSADTVSGSTATTISSAGGGEIPPGNSTGIFVSSGASTVTVSGSNATTVSSNGGGQFPPTGGVVTVVETVSLGSVNLTVASSTATATSTGSEGVIPPSSSAVFNTSSSTIIPPPIVNISSSAIPVETPVLNITVTTSSGIEIISIGSSTAVTSSTGLTGVIPPASSVSGFPPFVNISSGVEILSTASSTATFISVGSSGAIPPASANSSSTAPPEVTTAPGIAVFTTASSTFTATSLFGSGEIPPASVNSTSSSAAPTPQVSTVTSAEVSNVTVASSTHVSSGTGAGGIITPIVNISSTAPPSLTPSPSSNITTSLRSTGTNSDRDRTGSYSTTSSISGSIVPPANSTTTAPPSLTPSPSLNITTSLGSTGTNSDRDRTGSYSTTSSAISRSIVPPTNSTVTAPPSLTPSVSLNVTSSLGSTGTNSDRDRTGSYSTTSSSISRSVVLSMNSTSAAPPVQTPSASIPPLSANFTIPASSTPRSGIFTEITPSASVPVPSTNITSSLPVTETVVIPPTGGNITLSSSVTVVSVTIPSASVNITVPVTLPPISSTSVPSLTPSISVNTTYTPPFATGVSSSFPSGSPTPSLNSSTPSICPTEPVTVTVTAGPVSIQIVTTTVVQTVVAATGSASTLVDPASAVGASASPEAPAPSSAAPVPTPEAPTTSPEASGGTTFRARGDPATPAQRQAACKSNTNIIRNPDFVQGSDGSVPGWDVDTTDPNITVDSLADGNSTVAQFSSAAAGRELTVTQALTICPNEEYDLAASAQQATALADCAVRFTLVYADGTRVVVLRIMPGEEWTRQNATFTATGTPEVDMEITARCEGYKGAVVADLQGFMRVEVQGVSMVRDDD